MSFSLYGVVPSPVDDSVWGVSERYPGYLVRMDRARDAPLTPAALRRFQQGKLPPPPPDGSGVIGNPTAATADRGRQIYERILRAVRRAVFRPGENESDTL